MARLRPVACNKLLGRDDDFAQQVVVVQAPAMAVRHDNAEGVARVTVALVEGVEGIGLRLAVQLVACIVGVWRGTKSTL